MDKKKFFILDGSSLLYRAYYALPLLEAEAGVYTNAVVGFSNMLVRLLTDWQPDYLAIAFDKGKHTFRTDMFADYKGTRKPMPDELRSQVPMLHEMAEAWGVPLIELAGYEADDIIGTLANKAVAQGMAAYVVTGDRDALQLIRPDLTVLFTKKGISEMTVYDAAAFQAEYEGLDPIQLIDLKGLMGDTSDNIPGVPKVGPKTAVKLIAAYGSVEQVLLHIEEISGRALKERLRDNQQQAVLSKQLAAIRLDVPVEFAGADFALQINSAVLNSFYTKYNIRSMLRHVKKLAELYNTHGNIHDNASDNIRDSIDGTNGIDGIDDIDGGKRGSREGASSTSDTSMGQSGQAELPRAAVLFSRQEGAALAKKAAKAGQVYIMPAFEGRAPHKRLLAVTAALPVKKSGASFSEFGNFVELYYLPCEQAQGAVEKGGMESLFAGLEQENGTDVAVRAANPAWTAFLPVLADGKIIKYLHGLKGFYQSGIELSGRLVDLELVGYLLNPSAAKYGVEALAERYGTDIPDMPDISDISDIPAAANGTGGTDVINRIDGIDGRDKTDRADKNDRTDKNDINDKNDTADVTAVPDIRIWQCFVLTDVAGIMTDKLAALGMTKLYEELELPLVRVLADMEQAGIRVNRQKLQQQTVETGKKIQALEQEIYNLAGRKFNIASPKQLGEVLFEGLQLPVIKKTKTGYSTNVEVLNELYSLHPIIEKILDYRLWTKLKSTYLDGIAPLINEADGRVHTTFNQTVTATGRLSSSEPNLQNIPVRRQEGRHIRELFEPGEGYDMLLSADYSQIELRVLADMSQDENFLRAFRHQEDVHARTAAEVFGVPMAEVGADLRRKAKAVNFGIVYGISDYGLAQDLHIPREEAKEYIERYFARCQGIKAFIDRTVAEAKEKGYVLTMYGRRRDLPAIRSSNYNQRSLAERMAMNTPIQGTAADIIKLAMLRAHKALGEAGLKSRILLQVHDELVLEVKQEELAQVEAILREAMEQAASLSVPLTIDINTGRNWAAAK